MSNVAMSRRGQSGRIFTQKPNTPPAVMPIMSDFAKKIRLRGRKLFELVLWDTRTAGCQPKGDKVMKLDEKTSLRQFFKDVAKVCDEHNGNVYLKVIGHGMVGPNFEIDFEDIDLCHQGPIYEGGFGILFGMENLLYYNLANFLIPLCGKVKLIDLMSCGIANISVEAEDLWGDGEWFCKCFATIIGAEELRASDAIQCYRSRCIKNPCVPICGTDDRMNFGQWEGFVYTFNQSGDIIKSEFEPLL